MKIFVLLSVFTFVISTQGAGLTPAQIQKLKDSYNNCVISSKAETTVIDQAKGGNVVDNNAPLDNFLNCVLERSQLIKDGKLQKTVLRAKLPSDLNDETFEAIYRVCSKADNEPKEKAARVAYKCFLVESPVKIQLIQV